MVVSFLRGEAHVRRAHKQVIDEVLGLSTNGFPGLVVVVIRAVEDAVEDIIVVLALERRLARQHDEHDHAHAPIVAQGRVTSLQHLRSNVIRGTIWHCQQFVLR